MRETQPIRILVMEDDAGLARLCQKRLQRAGYEVDVARDGEEGLAMYAAGAYDVVAVDQTMPVHDGLDVIRIMASRGPLPPTIMVTGTGNERIAVEALKLGARDYVVRDAAGGYLDLLPSVIEGVLEQHRLDEQNREAQEALRRSEERFRLLVETSFDGISICEWDPVTSRRQLIFCNDRFVEMSGYTSEELENADDLNKLVVPRRSKQEWEPSRRRLLEGLPAGGTSSWTRPDGKKNIHEWSAVCARVGDKYHIMGIDHDITERKRAEEERRRLEAQIQHAQKLESLGVLAGGVAHDFNNLLVGVLGNASLALMELPPESPARHSIEQVEEAGERAAELCNQMLAYSGKGHFVVEPLNLSRLVEEMAHLLETAASKKAVLMYDFPEDLPAVEGDATQIRQVVMNLITNASESIGDRSGLIAVRTGVMEADRAYLATTYLEEDLPEGSYVYLEVSDTGCGMDAETRAKVFDPFFSTKFIGRGLGLAAVLGIVRGHGGAIKVYSEPDHGSVFKVLFPCAEGPALEAGREEEAPTAGWRGSGTILVVDDQQTVQAVAADTLERAGFSVLTAKDGCEATEVFRQHADRIVAVLLDLTMPHMSGEEAFGELRRIRDDIPVILSSGYTEEDAVGRFAGRGLAGFIQKPYQPRKLIAKIQQLLEPSAGG